MQTNGSKETDSLHLLAAKFGISVECAFNNKQIDITNFFSGGKLTVDVLALSCFLKGTIGAGENLNEVYEAIYGKSCPDFLEWNGKKYTLLQVGVTIEINDKGVQPSNVTMGIHQGGVQELKNDILAVYDQAKAFLKELEPMVVNVAIHTIPMAAIAFWSYKLLGELYSYFTEDEYGFERNKEIYIDACRGVVQELMERDSKDPVKLKALAKIARNKKKLEAHYKERMKEAKNIQIIKDIYDNLHKETEEGLAEAEEGRDQILTDVNLTYDSIYKVNEIKNGYQVYFKVRVQTSGPVVIPFVRAAISCNNVVLAQDIQDEYDTYDEATNKVYDGYYLEFSKSELEEALKCESICESISKSTWKLELIADFKGEFKDEKRVFDISKDIKGYF